MKKTVLFLSDRTGITAETLGHSLLTQFNDLDIRQFTMPFIDTVKKAQKIADKINQIAREESQPLVFCTLLNQEIYSIISKSDCILYDFFNHFIAPLEAQLGMKSSHTIGRTHGMNDINSYHDRIEAVNFSLNSDDGLGISSYDEADIILTGVSRSGKTPTSIYISIQYGIKVANYPLIEQDLEDYVLPDVLKPYKEKLFGLIITPDKLHQIRSERRAKSKYASLMQCEHEVHTSELMFINEKIPLLETSSVSIEEIATIIIDKLCLRRQLYG
jgi:regulator of PEP synthase PpsR (kinase-PPPase family)